MYDLKKIIVLNWRWDQELNFPMFVHSRGNRNQDSDFNFNTPLKCIPVVPSNWIENEEEPYLLKNDLSPSKFLIPNKVNLSSFDGKELKSLRRKFFLKVIENIQEQFPNTNKFEVIFLIHQGYGFEKRNKLLSMISKLPNISNQRDKFEIELDFFGNGVGEIYGKKGLLSQGPGKFKYKKPFQIGWFTDKYHIHYINQKYFDFVWRFYGYKTTNRLKEFRKWVKLGMTSKKKKPHLKLQKYTQNLLYHLGEWEEDTHKYLEEEGWDFSQCHDLKDWILDENAAFQSGEILINELKKLAAGTLTDYKELNKTLDQLILSFYE